MRQWPHLVYQHSWYSEMVLIIKKKTQEMRGLTVKACKSMFNRVIWVEMPCSGGLFVQAVTALMTEFGCIPEVDSPIAVHCCSKITSGCSFCLNV